MNDPEVSDLASVRSEHREARRIVRPGNPGTHAVIFVFLAIVISLAATTADVSVMFHTIVGELYFSNLDLVFSVLRFLTTLATPCIEDFLVILIRHHVEVEMATKHNPLLVRRNVRPAGMAVGLFPSVEFTQRPRADGVFKVMDLLLGPTAPVLVLRVVLLVAFGLFFLFFFILRRGDVELDRVGIHEADRRDRQVLAVIGILGDASQLGGNPIVIKDGRLGTRSGVHQDELPSRRSLVAVPEVVVRALDPDR